MAKADTSLRTPMARVRGLGAAKRGTEHFIAQRVSAIALVVLVLWFIWAVAAHAGAPYAVSAAFLGNPINAALMLLLVVVGLYHFALGMQVVIEDYVTGDGLKIACLIANRFVAALIGLASVIAILKLAV